MATIRNEILIENTPEAVWNAVRDFGAVHTRLARGFVTDCQLEGDTRIVTFANGLTAREILVSADDERRRLAYAITDGRTSHYNASVEVSSADNGRTRFVWIIDVLPNEFAGPIGAMAEQGVQAIKKALTK
jgi:hypothetical protein